MAYECIYIFDNKEDRRNVQKYQELAEVICRVKGFLEPRAICRARKMNIFHEVENGYEKQDYLPVYKKDIFLLVYGRPHLLNKASLYEMVLTDTERELVDHLLIGNPEHAGEDFWYENIRAEVKGRIFGNTAELMRKPEDKARDGQPRNGKYFYTLVDSEGTVAIACEDEIQGIIEHDPNFIRSHLVIWEGEAADIETAVRRMENSIDGKDVYTPDNAVKLPLYDYYAILLKYFIRLNKSCSNLPGNFWDWLTKEKEGLYFMRAWIYETMSMLIYDQEDSEDTAA